jgi:hypothetical protein
MVGFQLSMPSTGDVVEAKHPFLGVETHGFEQAVTNFPNCAYHRTTHYFLRIFPFFSEVLQRQQNLLYSHFLPIFNVRQDGLHGKIPHVTLYRLLLIGPRARNTLPRSNSKN